MYPAITVTLRSYSGETIPVLGSIDTEVRHKDQKASVFHTGLILGGGGGEGKCACVW